MSLLANGTRRLCLSGRLVDDALFEHATLRTMVAFAHVGGLVGGGGCAIAADHARATHVSGAAGAQRGDAILRSCRHVGLVFIFLSGCCWQPPTCLTYLESRVFWTKMAFVAALRVTARAGQRTQRRGPRGIAPTAPGARRSAWRCGS